MASGPPLWAVRPQYAELNMYGWTWSASDTVDANYLDLAYLVARNSTAKDGHMGCVLVSGIERGSGETTAVEQVGSVLLCTINTPLFGAYRSDCHAEANAVSECAACGTPARGTSCYVTRAPCVSCYKLLAMAGVARIIAPQRFDSDDCVASAVALGIECVACRDSDERAARREGLGSSNEDMDRVRALREERKRLRKERSFGKKAIRCTAGTASAPPNQASRDGPGGSSIAPVDRGARGSIDRGEGSDERVGALGEGGGSVAVCDADSGAE